MAAKKPAHGRLRTALDASVGANDAVTEVDSAVVEAGRVLADHIDYAAQNLTGQDLTKALYLMPHLMNTLRELEATPAARRSVQGAKPKPQGVGSATMKDEVGEKRAGRGWRSA